jgi:hypothetical protein
MFVSFVCTQKSVKVFMLNYQLFVRDKVVALRVECFNSGLAESSAILSFNFITSMNLSWLIVLQAGHRL